MVRKIRSVSVLSKGDESKKIIVKNLKMKIFKYIEQTGFSLICRLIYAARCKSCKSEKW